MKQKTVSIGSIKVANDRPFVLIGGPCVLESEGLALRVAKDLKKAADRNKIKCIFKASYDKANRTSHRSFRGLGLEKGLRILSRVKAETGLPLLTDVHSIQEVALVSTVVDVIQIPAFLSRQTDLIVAAASSGKCINIKKGQFLSPWEMRNVLNKVESTGNRQLLLTERGSSFGYNNLVVDMRGMEIMKTMGYPVIFDATHSVQLPGGEGQSSGGQREFILPLLRAAMGLGVAGIFLEVHPRPEKALSDGSNSVHLKDMDYFLSQLQKLDNVRKTIREKVQ